MITRFVFFLALLGALGIGLYDMFKDPSAETAAEALKPTPEKVERAREVVQPFVEYMAQQDAESLKQLAIDGDAELRQKLKEFPVDAILPGPIDVDATPLARSPRRPSLGPTGAPAPPGIDWYRDGAGDDD